MKRLRMITLKAVCFTYFIPVEKSRSKSKSKKSVQHLESEGEDRSKSAVSRTKTLNDTFNGADRIYQYVFII